MIGITPFYLTYVRIRKYNDRDEPRSVGLRIAVSGWHAHGVVIQVYTSQSELDFVRYIHIINLKFAVTNTGHLLCCK